MAPGSATLKFIVIAGHPAAGTGLCEIFTVPAAVSIEFRVPTAMNSVGAAAVVVSTGGDFPHPAAMSTMNAGKGARSKRMSFMESLDAKHAPECQLRATRLLGTGLGEQRGDVEIAVTARQR